MLSPNNIGKHNINPIHYVVCRDFVESATKFPIKTFLNVLTGNDAPNVSKRSDFPTNSWSTGGNNLWSRFFSANVLRCRVFAATNTVDPPSPA